MMAEVRRRDEAEERTELHHVIDQATDHLDGSKADLLHCSAGPLPSIRAAIKQTKANSLNDNTRDRSRPAITTISAEPLDDNNWFSASPVVFPSSPPSSWTAEIQAPPSYDQVIQEKTREEHIVRPTAAPRRSSDCTSTTCSTQTDPVRDKSAGKKPQKPPRPSLSRPECSSESGPLKSQESWDSGDQCTRSVTFHWETTAPPDPPPSATTYSVPALELRPVPLPRIKSRKQTEDNIQTLIKFEDNEVPTDAGDVSSNEYLKELLEVFSSNRDQTNQEEQVHGEMNSQRNIQARIKAFESQTAPEDGSASEPIKPQPLPRKPVKPTLVSVKPPLAARSLLVQDSQNVSSHDQTPVFKPQLPQKSAGKPTREELETLLTKGGPPHKSNPAVLTRDYSIHDEEPPLPPRPPVKHPKEPLKPNLNININNHNSTTVLRDAEYIDTPANPAPIKARPAVTRRPTTIRVPSQIVTESLQGNPPPLPARKPVGSLNTTTIPKQRSLPSIPTQELLRNKQVPLLPNQQENIRKPLPPRPPPAKPSPGRPPPPNVQTTKPPKGFLLPPRPVQGHRLYDKYTLPHGSAALDFNSSRTGEFSFQAAGPTCKQENGLKVQALHDFIPEGPGELGLKAGDIINMVERVDSEWYRGTCKGSTGYFPVNFAKVIPDAPTKPVPEKKQKPISVTWPRCVARDFEGESGEELPFAESDVGNEWAHGQMGATSAVEDLPPPPAQQQSRTNPNWVALPGMTNCASKQPEVVKPAQSSVEWVLARHDFDGKAEDELSFKRGDCILLTKHIDGDWSSGRFNGKEGLFPKAFVESRAGPKLSNNNQFEVGVVKGRAMYDFTSDCDEELSLQVGDVIINLESMDDEWFMGDLRGKRALVPKNYVQVL
ncbi:SH3 domain-containing protein 19 isoform X2 [Phyllopteryx taeniolatus]|uniref:SH3 domain-containing protein 19 isoform X2 n=1 Tax=Phyllopteryx taeniolatus TaxID=161469 RepID=UPI002AD46F28|nr:SH3 domain-containing protein 19 isoform X2 [Phyllopteryx taeniolatus]